LPVIFYYGKYLNIHQNEVRTMKQKNHKTRTSEFNGRPKVENAIEKTAVGHKVLYQRHSLEEFLSNL